MERFKSESVSIRPIIITYEKAFLHIDYEGQMNGDGLYIYIS